MAVAESAARYILLVLVVLLPFEFETPFRGLSILQLAFLAAALVATPILARDWRQLARDRLILAGAALVGVFWLSAMLAADYQENAIRGATRVTCGWVLLCIASRVSRRDQIERVWTWTALVASVYAISDYLGFGFRSLFRTDEFWVGETLRLSGSFEYPNTAAAFFAMSLPLVWARFRPACLLVWTVLLLTYSRGAFIGILVVLMSTFLLKRDKGCIQLAAIGLVLFAVFWGGQFVVAHAEEGLSAQYTLEFNHLRVAPGVKGTMPVTIRNTGTATWQNVVLSYHWYNTGTKRIVFIPEHPTPLPAMMAPGAVVNLQAAFETPPDPGFYLLDWDLKDGERWFSIDGRVAPGIVEADVQPGTVLQFQSRDVSRWYRRGPGRALDASVQRLQLWEGAWQLIRTHPLLGTGPDSFRLLYGATLGYKRWDTNIRANSLYLELLTSCGVLGLIAFAGTMAAIRWTVQPAALAAAVFLVHGVVDSFLMTTPIYFAFWVLVGTLHHRELVAGDLSPDLP
jgi:hypothetical protein